jgi:ABC-2 type transport system permease protein
MEPIKLFFCKEFKHMARNKNGLLMRVLFPLALILILGTALSGSFEDSTLFKTIDLLYLDSSPAESRGAFKSFLDAGVEMGMRFHRTESRKSGIAGVKDGKYACFIVNNPKGPVLYINESRLLEARLAETVLNGFLLRYSVRSAIGEDHPTVSENARRTSKPDELLNETSLNPQRKPRAVDYYAVTMLTLIIMYSAIAGAYAIKREESAHTATRLLFSPVKNSEILTGKILGVIFVTLLQALVILLTSKYLFQVYWGDLPVAVMALLISEVIMAVSFGIGLAFIIKKQLIISGFLNLAIPALVFLGGGYFPVERFGKLFSYLAVLSPLRWSNQALFLVIYSSDLSMMIPAILLNLAVAVFFIGMASCLTRREAFLG